MSDNQKKKKSGKEKAILIADNETQSKVNAILDEMLSEKREQKGNVVLAIIKQNLSKIDALCKKGFSLAEIYVKLTKQIPLGISSSSFTQYVRKIRQEVGSDLYKAREQKTSKSPDTQKAQKETAPAARAEKIEAPLSAAVQAETSQKWNCPQCALQAKKYGTTWICPACNASYQDDNGKISGVRIKK